MLLYYGSSVAAKSNSEPSFVVEKTGKRGRDVLTQTLLEEKTSWNLCSAVLYLLGQPQ